MSEGTRYTPALAKALETERKGARLSVTAFAARLGISPSWYRQIREGYRPPAGRIMEMAANYGVPVAPWLAAAGYSDAESTGPFEPVVRWGTPAERELPEILAPDAGTIGDDGLVELSHPLEGIGVFVILVVAESLGTDYRRGDRVLARTDGKARKDQPVIVKEPDGTLRLVRVASVKGGQVQIRPVGALGLKRSQPLDGEIIAFCEELRRKL